MPLDGIAPADLAACEELLARGSKSFGTASRLLPKRVRQGATVLYAFCRVADDLVDDGGTEPAVAVAALRTRLDAIFAGHPGDDPVDRALSILVQAERLPRAPLDALVEGFAWDAEGRTYETMEDLVGYATRVAGSVGVAMTVLMGSRKRDVLARACDLGIAMQLTNVARDVGEDAARGRVYLPNDILRTHGVDRGAFLRAPRFSPGLGDATRHLLDVADDLYARADQGIPALPKDCRAAIASARAVYADIGRSIRTNGYDSVSQRAFVSTRRKLWLVARSMTARFAPLERNQLALPPLPESRALIEASASA